MPTTYRIQVRTGVLACALLLATAGLARADKTLTLDDALALARAHNRDLRAAHERITEANASVDQARAALLPTLTAQGKYTHNNKEVDFDAAALAEPTFGLATAIHDTASSAAQAAAIDAFTREANAA